MVIILWGILFLVYAIGNLMGRRFFVPARFKDAEFREEMQRGQVLPNLIMGVGYMILGWGNWKYGWENMNTVMFCAAIVAIAAVALVMLILNRKKYI